VILKGLKDSDAQVRMYSAQTLTKFPMQNAINPLIEILKSDENESAKQAAKEALMVHSQKSFGRNLARLLIKALPHVSEPNDRVRVVQILSSEVPLKQIKTAPKEHDDNIEYDLYQYYTEKEQNAMVKDELSGLLFLLGN
jgi:HEAT repeat protein